MSSDKTNAAERFNWVPRFLDRVRLPYIVDYDLGCVKTGDWTIWPLYANRNGSTNTAKPLREKDKDISDILAKTTTPNVLAIPIYTKLSHGDWLIRDRIVGAKRTLSIRDLPIHQVEVAVAELLGVPPPRSESPPATTRRGRSREPRAASTKRTRSASHVRFVEACEEEKENPVEDQEEMAATEWAFNHFDHAVLHLASSDLDDELFRQIRELKRSLKLKLAALRS